LGTHPARTGQFGSEDPRLGAVQEGVDPSVGRVQVQDSVKMPVTIEQFAKVFPVAFGHGIRHLHGQALTAVQNPDRRRLARQVK
jgi:hypothetical protein